MIAGLNNAALKVLVSIINECFRTGDYMGIPAPDFLALRKKAPVFFIATCRAILNLITLWKVLTLVAGSLLRSHALKHGVITPKQFALYPVSAPAGLLRVFHDTIFGSWATSGESWAVLDDVSHPYGSIGHRTMRNLLLCAGSPDALSLLVVYAAKWIKIHYGGPSLCYHRHHQMCREDGCADPRGL